ncbi:MAG: glycosyltransferase family 4 protein [Candidatus Peregrinibacteria bacterium]
MRKVLFLDQYGEIGGGQRILLDIIAASASYDWKPVLLCPDGPLAGEAQSLGAEVTTWDIPSISDGRKSLRDLMSMHRWARSAARDFQRFAQDADLIVVNGLRSLPVAERWRRELNIPVILYLHGTYTGLQQWLIRSFLRRQGSRAIAPSPIVAQPFRRLKNIHVIANWVSRGFLAPPARSAKLRSLLAIHDALPLILVPGRYCESKGQRIALEAMKTFPQGTFHLVFSGKALFEKSGPSVELLLKQAAAENPFVHVLHWDRPLPELYDGADLVLMPSIFAEPFGLVAIEAMARTIPLIVSDRGHLPELAGHGRFAEVTAPTSEDVAKSIQKFLDHRSAWLERAEQSRIHVQEYFEPTEALKEVYDLFALAAH